MIKRSNLVFSSDFLTPDGQNFEVLTLSLNFGFHGPPLLTLKTDRLDLRGLDQGKVTSFTLYLKITACKQGILYMQSTSLIV